MNTLQSFTGNLNQFNERKRVIKNKWLKKFRDPSFMDELWINLLVAPFVLSLVLLIGMHIVHIFLWT